MKGWGISNKIFEGREKDYRVYEYKDLALGK
jgi:hypothetical protein